MGKFRELLRGAGKNRPAAGIDKGTFRLLDQLNRLLQLLIRIFPVNALIAFLRLFRMELRGICGNILSYVNQYRPRSSAFRDFKGLPQGIRKNVDILDDIAVLCNRHRNAGDIHLLEGILSQKRQGYVCRNRDQRNRIHIGGSDSRYQIRRSRPRGRKADSHLSRRSGVAVRRVGCPLLMGGQIVRNLLTIIESVINIQDRSTGIAEHRINALLL